MYRFKVFINEAMNPFADKNPIGGGGMGGGGFAPKSRMAPAARMPDNSIVAGKPGDAHSDLIPRLAGKDKPKELGFVRSHPGEDYKGNSFLSREKASELGKRNPNLLNDPDQAKDKPWQAQSYDFKPESGKARKRIKEAIDYILEKEDKAKKKKPATKKDNKGKLGIANKESMHGGKAFYGPGEC